MVTLAKGANEGVRMESSEEVRRWGEAWLKAWCDEPGLPESDRENRLWIAEGWRTVDLETIFQWWQERRRFWGGKGREKFEADHEAYNLARWYHREHNGLLVWRMYSAYRRAGEPVPEWVLWKLDQWADRLEHASGTRAIAAAIEMTNPKGGAHGAKQLKMKQRQRLIASDVATLHRTHKDRPGGFTLKQAIEATARNRRLTTAIVKKAYHDYMRPQARSAAVVSSETDAAMRAMVTRTP